MIHQVSKLFNCYQRKQAEYQGQPICFGRYQKIPSATVGRHQNAHVTSPAIS